MKVLKDSGFMDQYSLGMNNDDDYKKFQDTIAKASDDYDVQRGDDENMYDFMNRLHTGEVKKHADDVLVATGVKREFDESDDEYLARVVQLQVKEATAQTSMAPVDGESDSDFLSRVGAVERQQHEMARSVEELQRVRRMQYAAERGLSRQAGETDDDFHQRVTRWRVYDANVESDAIQQQTGADSILLNDFIREEMEDLFGPAPSLIA